MPATLHPVYPLPTPDHVAGLHRAFRTALRKRHRQVLDGLEGQGLDVDAWREADLFAAQPAHPAAYLAHYGLESRLEGGIEAYLAAGPRVPSRPPHAVTAAGSAWEDHRLDEALAGSEGRYAGFTASIDPRASTSSKSGRRSRMPRRPWPASIRMRTRRCADTCRPSACSTRGRPTLESSAPRACSSSGPCT